jgi:hypothetical protein
MSASQVGDFYVNNGSSMFERAKWYMKLHQKYEAEPLALILQQALNRQLNCPGYIYQEIDPLVELGDHRLRGLLMLVLRNHPAVPHQLEDRLGGAAAHDAPAPGPGPAGRP